jgi:hypothetical protein
VKNRTEPPCEPRKAGRPGPTGPGGPGDGSPPVSSGTRIFDFLVWSENFKGSQEKENMVSRVFLPELFKCTRWELGVRHGYP